jgi:hypothetical protein
MTARHTPGPWKVSDNGEVYAVDSGDSICMVLLGPNGISNARLIGASPDLAEALHGVVRICEALRYTAGLGKNQLKRIDAAHAALAKAGAQP